MHPTLQVRPTTVNSARFVSMTKNTADLNPGGQEVSIDDGARDERSNRKRRRRIGGRQPAVLVHSDSECFESPVVQEVSIDDGASQNRIEIEPILRLLIFCPYCQI
jgi:hypothetical protein